MTRSLRTLPLLSSVLIAGAIGPVNVLVFSLFWVLGAGRVPTQNPAQRQPTSVSFRQRFEGDAKSGSKLTKHLPSRAGLGSEAPRKAGKEARRTLSGEPIPTRWSREDSFRVAQRRHLCTSEQAELTPAKLLARSKAEASAVGAPSFRHE